MLWPVGNSGGAEPAADFLAKLRHRGYQDVALEYLERMGGDPQCPPDLKDALDYQLGVTLADGLSRSASPAVQAAQLRQARARLEKFLEEHPRKHALTFEAKTRLARVLTDLGKLEAEMAAAVEESSPDRGRLLGEARGSFQAAQQDLEALEKQLQDELASYPPYLDEKDPRYKRWRDLDRQLMELPLEIGGAIDGRAKTYRPADKEHRELLTAAAARYHRLYAKHSSFYGGIYARMCEGRVLQELGRTSEAIEAFQDIWSQVGEGEQVRAIRDQTLVLMLKTYSHPAVKRYQEALTLAAAWQKTADQAEQSSPGGLQVHYQAGLAAVSLARTLAEGSATRREAMHEAKNHFDFVAGHCGELQGQAWERSAELSTVLAAEGKRGQPPFVRSTRRAGTDQRLVPANGDCPLSPPPGGGTPASFALAKAAGDAAWDRMTALRVKAQEAKIRQDQERCDSQADQAARQAIGFYRRALAGWTLAAPPLSGASPDDRRRINAETSVAFRSAKEGGFRGAKGDNAGDFESPDDRLKPELQTDCLNLVRYRLAYLLFAAGQYDDAGLLGEFLAQHYPDAAEARKAAEISVEAYRNVLIQRLRAATASCDGEPLSTEAIRQATDSVTERLFRVGRYLIGRWPKEAEAVEAARMLIDTAVDRRDATSAEAFLATLPAACSYRPQAELRVGQAWWESYVEAAPIVGEDRLPPEELRKLAQRAQTVLQQGIEDSQAGRRQVAPPEYALVYSAFALAQMAMDQGQTDEAVRWLDDPAIGPMTLLSSGSPASGDLLALGDQTLLLAVLSYASARLPDKALDALVRLESRALRRGDPLAGRQLARQYHLAGRRLRKVLLRLELEGKADDVQQITIGQDLLLGRIAQLNGPTLPPGEGRGEGRLQRVSSFTMQVWVAETCLALGDDGQRPPESSEAAVYVRRAVQTCLAILDQLQKTPSWGPPDAPSDIQVRLAAGLRAQGQYRKALDRLTTVLAQKNLRIDAQIEAARTWQTWGQEDPGCYLRAIRGDSYALSLPGGTSRQVPIWGWEEIARQLGPFPRYWEQFLDARYNLAVCRTRLAATQTGTSREETLAAVAAEVAAIRLRLPSAGPVWAARFENLLREIEKARKVKVSGSSSRRVS
jgi:hypothetical protein